MKKQFDLVEIIDNSEKILKALSTIVECGNVILANLKLYNTETSRLEVKEVIDQEEETSAPAIEEKKPLTKEQVRAALAAKSNADGGKYRTEVKALVKKYSNGGSLTDVDVKDYEALISEVEGL